MIRIFQARATDNMPTMARLVAALALAGTAAVMAPLLAHYYPEEEMFVREMSGLAKLFAVIGFLVGWKYLGKKIKEQGDGTGIGLGLQAGGIVAALAIAALALVRLGNTIIRERLQGADPIEGIYLFGETALEYGIYLLHPQLFGIGAFMAITVGVLTRNTNLKYR